MQSRIPIATAAALALLALCFALWSFHDGEGRRDEEGRRADSTSAAARESLSGRGPALLKDRPLPQSHPAGGVEADQAQIPPRGPASGETPKAGGDAVATGGDAVAKGSGGAQMTRAERAEARHKELQAVAAARATEEGVAVASDPPEASHEGPPEPQQSVPTFGPNSIYDGLSQDDLLELMVAERRIRDAGVFVKLSPDQYFDVQKLLPDLQGVQDANEITQRILGMGVGEWLEQERGPKGRFVLH